MRRTTQTCLAATTLVALLLAGCHPGGVRPHAGACTVTPGNASLVIRADRMLPGAERPVPGELRVEGERIACVGDDCTTPGATLLDCPGSLLTPGLINPHDHLGWTTKAPMPTPIRYDNRYQWQGKQGDKPVIPYGDGDYSDEALAWGEIRHLMGATTSVIGIAGAPGLARNLDVPKLREGIPGKLSYNTYPWHASIDRITTESCQPYDFITREELRDYDAFEPHTAEGIDDVANFFLQCESGQLPHGPDLEMEKSAFIHAVAATEAQARRMVDTGTAWIWSPRSNVSLYGMTASLAMYKRLGMKMAISSDWTISGSMNLLREFRCAERLNRDYYGAPLSDRELVELATTGAAVATHTEGWIGGLTAGRYADLALFAPSADPARPYAAVLAADPQDVRLVMRGGEVLYGDAAIVEGLGAGGCDALDVCGSGKRFCLKGRSIEGLRAFLAEKHGQAPYPLFFCGTPEKEPSCVPGRAGEFSGVRTSRDWDGDGVLNAVDNCPTVFNPVRPMDGGIQGGC